MSQQDYRAALCNHDNSDRSCERGEVTDVSKEVSEQPNEAGRFNTLEGKRNRENKSRQQESVHASDGKHTPDQAQGQADSPGKKLCFEHNGLEGQILNGHQLGQWVRKMRSSHQALLANHSNNPPSRKVFRASERLQRVLVAQLAVEIYNPADPDQGPSKQDSEKELVELIEVSRGFILEEDWLQKAYIRTENSSENV